MQIMTLCSIENSKIVNMNIGYYIKNYEYITIEI